MKSMEAMTAELRKDFSRNPVFPINKYCTVSFANLPSSEEIECSADAAEGSVESRSRFLAQRVIDHRTQSVVSRLLEISEDVGTGDRLNEWSERSHEVLFVMNPVTAKNRTISDFNRWRIPVPDAKCVEEWAIQVANAGARPQICGPSFTFRNATHILPTGIVFVLFRPNVKLLIDEKTEMICGTRDHLLTVKDRFAVDITGPCYKFEVKE